MRPFVARHMQSDRAPVVEEPAAAGVTINPGDFVVRAGDGTISAVTTADPASLLGIARSGTQSNQPEPGRINIAAFDDSTLIAMTGTRAPAATDVGVDYGITRNARGEWEVDPAKVGGATENRRVRVIDVALNRNWYLVQVLAAYRQGTVGK